MGNARKECIFADFYIFYRMPINNSSRVHALLNLCREEPDCLECTIYGTGPFPVEAVLTGDYDPRWIRAGLRLTGELVHRPARIALVAVCRTGVEHAKLPRLQHSVLPSWNNQNPLIRTRLSIRRWKSRPAIANDFRQASPSSTPLSSSSFH